MKATYLLNIVLSVALLFLCIKLSEDKDGHHQHDKNNTAKVSTATVSETVQTEEKQLHEFDVENDFECNPFEFFTGDGLLLAAGNREKSNAMTIGWGTLGTLWGGKRSVVTVYVAEKRYTHEFMERSAYFTVMAFKDKNVLRYMGSHSGRDGLSEPET